MTSYTEKTPEDGYYELNLGFFWQTDDREERPQYLTVTFQVTDEMEEDYPGEEAENKYGFEQAERQREEWLADNLQTLLNFGFVKNIYGHEEISSIEEFKQHREELSFDAYYK